MDRAALQERLGVPLEFHSGWDPLITRLVDDLDALGLSYEVCQVKEKFGGLRFYWLVKEPEDIREGLTEDEQKIYYAMQARIDEAEDESLRTCEICGEPGRPQGKSWTRTSCDQHKL